MGYIGKGNQLIFKFKIYFHLKEPDISNYKSSITWTGIWFPNHRMCIAINERDSVKHFVLNYFINNKNYNFRKYYGFGDNISSYISSATLSASSAGYLSFL